MTIFIRQTIFFLAALIQHLGRGGARSAASEIAILKHQLIVVARQHKRAPRLTPGDRFALAFASLFVSPRRLERAAIILKPSTLLAFHKALIRRKYSILSGKKQTSRPGPKGPSQELVAFAIAMKKQNPRFGCGKIALAAVRAFGYAVDADTVRRIMQKHYKPDPGGGPSWLTFLGHSKDSLWSLDLFRCESLLLQSYWVMLVMDQFSRKIIGFAVCQGAPDGPTICWMLGRATAGSAAPKYLSTDHDPLFTYHQWEANLRVLGVEAVKSVPYTPTSHPFVERLIGTVRREYLDHTLFWGQADLERKLQEYAVYYNEHRVHYAHSDGRTPCETITNGVAPTPIKQIAWKPHCRGLFVTPIAA